MQGKGINNINSRKALRITPACAGKSRNERVYGNNCKDHPCVCREKAVDDTYIYPKIGSPLRVQGKDCVKRRNYKNSRITPACAGKRSVVIATFWDVEDHPCVCREKNRSLCKHPPQIRITPACAGKSSTLCPGATRYEDHPCVCREKVDPSAASFITEGSPLRVQGKEKSKAEYSMR